MRSLFVFSKISILEVPDLTSSYKVSVFLEASLASFSSSATLLVFEVSSCSIKDSLVRVPSTSLSNPKIFYWEESLYFSWE